MRCLAAFTAGTLTAMRPVGDYLQNLRHAPEFVLKATIYSLVGTPAKFTDFNLRQDDKVKKWKYKIEMDTGRLWDDHFGHLGYQPKFYRVQDANFTNSLNVGSLL